MTGSKSSIRTYVRVLVVGALAAIAIAFGAKALVFDPNWPLRPTCFSEDGFYGLDGPQTRIFREALASSTLLQLMQHGYRVDGRNVYISLLDYDENTLHNHTKNVVAILEATQMNNLFQNIEYMEIKKKRGEFPPRPSAYDDIDCELIAAIAIK